ncbi:MAG: carbohydrate ABC transporter permease [Clostridia bacterium]|nr:carbohydrate ABC transporter permease [Clostridia bacterium]
MDSSKTQITKETKNKIVVDYEGKMSAKERLRNKLKASQTWIKTAINALRFILMLGVSYVILFPFFSKIAGSFMSRADVVDATVSLVPKNFTLEQYKYIFLDNHYAEAFLNTLLLSLLCALIQTFVSCLVGYGLAKFKFKGNKIIMGLVVVTMIIPHSALDITMLQHFTHFDILRVMSINDTGIITLISEALTGKHVDATNTFLPFIVLSLGGIAFKNGLYIYMMRQFFKGVPDELEESAYVDGCGTFRTFLQIILPLSVPMMITIFLFAFSWQWTDQFYTGLFFTLDGDNGGMWMMPDVFRITESLSFHLKTDFAGRTVYENVIQNTAGMMIIAPLIIMYLFCQKYLVQGIERSGLVG